MLIRHMIHFGIESLALSMLVTRVGDKFEMLVTDLRRFWPIFNAETVTNMRMKPLK